MYLFENFKPKEITEQNKILFSSLLNAPVRKLIEQRTDGLYLVQDFYPSGIKRTDPFLVSDENHTSYYELTSTDFHYAELTIVGDLTVWYENSQKMLECNYHNFRLEGVCKKWYENGIQKDEENWSLGKRQGVFRRWYKNGQLAKEEHWGNDKLEGELVEYYANGQISYRAYLRQGRLEGVVKKWYENGQIKYRKEYQNDKCEGFTKHWYKTGILAAEENYKDGRKDGLCTNYYETGRLKTKIQYKNGIEYGSCFIFRRNGEFLKRTQKGFRGGLSKDIIKLTQELYNRYLLEIMGDSLYLVQDFYETGEKLTEPYYLICKDEAKKEKFENLNYLHNEKITGLFIQYNRYGNKLLKGNFIEGKKEGEWFIWSRLKDIDCPLEETHLYKNNILKKKVTWHINGNKKAEFLYQDKKEKKIVSYNDDGSFTQSFLIKISKIYKFNCICRKVINITKDNHYLVQDFYYSGEKVSDPYLVKKIGEVESIGDYNSFTSITGTFVIWYTSVGTNLELHGLSSPLITNFMITGQTIANIKKQRMAYKYCYNRKGKLHGLYQAWHPSGEKYKEGCMRNGKEFGKWLYWNEEGKKTMERYYFMGVMIRENKFK